ncbi:HipA domain-containing protein [soil metagenome]
MIQLDKCPSTLKGGFDGYSPAALRRLFNGKKVSHILPFLPPEKDASVNELFQSNRKRISISGVQLKLSLILDGNKLRLSNEGERGQYILKPIPNDLRSRDQVPANEHVTMQIASQVFEMQTAENALLFFEDGQPAYLTKRFDIKPDGSKKGMEDFASLAGKTKDTAGEDYKYESNYEEMFVALRNSTGAYPIESIKLFRLILFNYVFSNGDAHLKNYSLIETEQTDYIFSPAYDLINTKLHIDDSDIALKKGLFTDGYKRVDFRETFGHNSSDFRELGRRAGISNAIVERELTLITSKKDQVKQLVKNSFLDDASVTSYLNLYDDKRNRLTRK